jgi:hypothetical protein
VIYLANILLSIFGGAFGFRIFRKIRQVGKVPYRHKNFLRCLPKFAPMKTRDRHNIINIFGFGIYIAAHGGAHLGLVR